MNSVPITGGSATFKESIVKAALRAGDRVVATGRKRIAVSTALGPLNQRRGKNGRRHLSQIELFSHSHAPIEIVDVASGWFTAPQSEYQSCSQPPVQPRRLTVGARRSMSSRRKPDGAALHLGDWPTRSPETHSNSWVFVPMGRTKVGVI